MWGCPEPERERYGESEREPEPSRGVPDRTEPDHRDAAGAPSQAEATDRGTGAAGLGPAQRERLSQRTVRAAPAHLPAAEQQRSVRTVRSVRLHPGEHTTRKVRVVTRHS